MALPFANKVQEIPITLSTKQYEILGEKYPDVSFYMLASQMGIPITGSPKEAFKKVKEMIMPWSYIEKQLNFINNLSPFEREVLNLYTITDMDQAINKFLRTGGKEIGVETSIFTLLILYPSPVLHYLTKKDKLSKKLNQKSEKLLISNYNETRYGKAKNIEEMIANIKKYYKNNLNRYYTHLSSLQLVPSVKQRKEMKTIFLNYLKLFCEIFNKAPPVEHPFRVFRGIGMYKDIHLSNETFVEKGIMSTSPVPNVAQGYSYTSAFKMPHDVYPTIMYIDIPKGHRGILLADTRTTDWVDQMEFVLAPMSQFKKLSEYIEKSEKKQRLNVHLLLVNDGCKNNMLLEIPEKMKDFPEEERKVIKKIYYGQMLLY